MLMRKNWRMILRRGCEMFEDMKEVGHHEWNRILQMNLVVIKGIVYLE